MSPSKLLKARSLPEGARFYGEGYQFNRLSLVEILEYVLGYLGTKKLSVKERDIEKCVSDGILLVKGTPGHFVYLSEDEMDQLGIWYYMRYMKDIRRKLAMAGKMRKLRGKW